MVLLAPPQHPALGDRLEAFTQRFGLPLAVIPAAGGIVRRFQCAPPLNVFFRTGRAVAVHCPYASEQVPGLFWPADLPDKPRLLVADKSWLVATPDCPWVYLRELVSLCDGARW